jgi:hypothetical protein
MDGVYKINKIHYIYVLQLTKVINYVITIQMYLLVLCMYMSIIGYMVCKYHVNVNNLYLHV